LACLVIEVFSFGWEELLDFLEGSSTRLKKKKIVELAHPRELPQSASSSNPSPHVSVSVSAFSSTHSIGMAHHCASPVASSSSSSSSFSASRVGAPSDQNEASPTPQLCDNETHAITLAFIRAFTGRKVKRYAIYSHGEGVLPVCSSCKKVAHVCACTTQIYAPHEFKKYDDSCMWTPCLDIGCVFHHSSEWPKDLNSKEMYNACLECKHPKILCVCAHLLGHGMVRIMNKRSNMNYQRYMIYTADHHPICSKCRQPGYCRCNDSGLCNNPHRMESLDPPANFFSRDYKCKVAGCYLHRGHKWFKKNHQTGHLAARVLKRMPCKKCAMPKMVCICNLGVTQAMILAELHKRQAGAFDRYAIYYLGGAYPVCSKCHKMCSAGCDCDTEIHAPHGLEERRDLKCDDRSCYSHTGSHKRFKAVADKM